MGNLPFSFVLEPDNSLFCQSNIFAWQAALSSDLKAKQIAEGDRGVGVLPYPSPANSGSQMPSTFPWEHQIAGRWKSSSGADPGGEAKAHMQSAVKAPMAAKEIGRIRFIFKMNPPRSIYLLTWE